MPDSLSAGTVAVVDAPELDAVAENTRAVLRRAAAAACRAGRSPADVRVVAAAKTAPAELVTAAIRAGIRAIGENYVQEAASKKPLVAGDASWHLIGRLQSNKAKRAVELFDVVQCVDSASLLARLERHAAAAARKLPMLIEVNVAGEASKSGVTPEQLGDLVAAARDCESLSLQGLMALPPRSDESQARSYFRRMRELCDRHSLRDLSVGMTQDFEAAIEEGATIVRVGTAIFGERRANADRRA